MSILSSELRNQLGRVIINARQVAEAGARKALESMAVERHEPHGSMSIEDRKLRNRLRARGRQLGDVRDKQRGSQSIYRLAHEVAYEHWHRMLFTRFLAENELLIHPKHGVAVSLDEIEELAREAGEKPSSMATRFAQDSLPQIFRRGDPVLEITLAPETRQALDKLLDSLPTTIFTADDSLGWTYQYWQAEKKDAVNESGGKIGADELPAVTQLFTEHYMVSFLLDNSLGAWWAARRLTEADLQNASSEEELRRKAAIPGVPLDYLRFVQQEDDTGITRWTPAAGTFDAWPEQLAELKTLDPCCGSGHFLVAAFLMLVPMRMEHDGLSAREAVDAVLQENIHGLELDQRCVGLAAFALALTAWKYPSAGGYRVLPELNVACSGLSVSVAKEEWKKLGLGKKNLTIALEWMHDTFKDAPLLGSLLNPAKSPLPMEVRWEEIQPLLEQALNQEKSPEEDQTIQQEVAVVAQGLAKSATILAGKYQWVITNVPYLARGKQNGRLRDFCEKYYSAAKNDLATVFLDRCLELCVQGGTSSIVLPQNWLFLTSYKKFREKLLKNDTWHLIARLGPGAFETISGEVVKAILISLSRGNSTKESGGLFGDVNDGNLIRGVDVSEPRTASEKAAQLMAADIKSVEQVKQLENPDARVAFDDVQGDLLEDYAISYKGITTGDDPKYRRKFWDFEQVNDEFRLFQSTVKSQQDFGGGESVVWYEEMTNPIQPGVYLRASEAMGKRGIMVSQMGQLPVVQFSGTPFDTNAGALISRNESHLPAIWCFCSSPEYNEAVRQIDQSLKVTNATLVKVPFDLDHWSKVAEERYPNGLPKPYTDDPNQWIFHGHPCGSVIWDEEEKWTAHGPLRTDDSVLHVAAARLLGYHWPAELHASMELADEQRKWVKRCEALASYADEDGIVCIPPVLGEAAASDRLLNLLAAAFNQNGGDAWSNDTLAALLKSADHAGKTLEAWLRDKFFEEHCKLFHHRPFVWHIWDGNKGGFHCLVNAHKLTGPSGEGRRTLETMTYSYLGDWIDRQKVDQQEGKEGADARLAAAQDLQGQLMKILEGEPPYDLFVRWKPLHELPIGWEPNINDGMRLNIRPFMNAELRTGGKKGAGILRWKPNINWGKDRGKEPQSLRLKVDFPWFWGCKGEGSSEERTDFAGGNEFDGNRWNDLHYTNELKRAAKELIE